MQQKSEFDKRKLFPFTYLHWRKTTNFSLALFYLDLVIWATPLALATVLTIFILR